MPNLLKVTAKFPDGDVAYREVKDIYLYPEGDSNTGAFASMEFKYSDSSRLDKFRQIYRKPQSLKIEVDNG